MRFIIATSLVSLFILTPCIWSTVKLSKSRNKPPIHIIFLWLISLLAAILLFCLHNSLSQWILWGIITVYLPFNTYILFDLTSAIPVLHKNIGKILHITGTAVTVILFSAFIAGMLLRNNVKIRNITIESDNLPSGFNDMRIVHITDLHIGNLMPQQQYLDKISSIIKELHPDLLLFTGDLISKTAEEADKIRSLFDTHHASSGCYAVFGNHDYGDYAKWADEESKIRNIDNTKEVYARLGFTLLNDTAIYLYSGSDSISLIGVGNWSKPPFICYGNMEKAVQNHRLAPFSILLTHDPNHWQEEVIRKYGYIDLTLSGHTHAAQIGIDCPPIKFSPSKWIFDYWDGLYTHENQNLIVSRGLGYVGIPFRLGMPPEITVITLKSGL